MIEYLLAELEVVIIIGVVVDKHLDELLLSVVKDRTFHKLVVIVRLDNALEVMALKNSFNYVSLSLVKEADFTSHYDGLIIQKNVLVVFDCIEQIRKVVIVDEECSLPE